MLNGKIIIARIWTGFGGDIPSRTPVICGIDPKKYETISIYLSKASDNPNIFEQKGQKVFYLSDKKHAASFSPLMILKLAKLLKNQKVDIVHCHKHKATIHGIIAAKLARVPFRFSHVHGLRRSRNLKRRLLNRIVLKHVTKILTVGDAVKQDVLAANSFLKDCDVISIGNSIDHDKFSAVSKNPSAKTSIFNIDQNNFVFASVGRLSQTKGQIYLIKAFAKLNQAYSKTKLLIAGDGPLKQSLQKTAADLNCEKSVIFLGQFDDISLLYSTADCFVLPSIAEGTPRALLEAMAAGIFCIGTTAGSIGEILGNGSLGFVVPIENQNALAEAMLKALQMTQEEKKQYALSGQKHIFENYSHPVIIKKLEKIYDDLANIPTSPAMDKS
ncbi:MAG: glycosyltransferase [Anaerohalosphaeraceae bacterium]|nr:glycosyltransferase [Anaerohalosphaeraceae bacterium]